MSKRLDLGFSLLEVMTVVAIVGVLVSLAIPSFNDYFEKARLRGAADSVVGLMAQSRAEAVKRNRQAVIAKVGSGATWCFGATWAPNPAALGDPMPTAVACDCSDNTPVCEVGIVSSVAARGVTIDNSVFNVVFDNKNGGSVDFATPATTFTSASTRFALSLRGTAAGQARVCRLASSGAVIGYSECES